MAWDEVSRAAATASGCRLQTADPAQWEVGQDACGENKCALAKWTWSRAWIGGAALSVAQMRQGVEQEGASGPLREGAR
jgi:hypothetical protein